MVSHLADSVIFTVHRAALVLVLSPISLRVKGVDLRSYNRFAVGTTFLLAVLTTHSLSTLHASILVNRSEVFGKLRRSLLRREIGLFFRFLSFTAILLPTIASVTLRGLVSIWRTSLVSNSAVCSPVRSYMSSKRDNLQNFSCVAR